MSTIDERLEALQKKIGPWMSITDRIVLALFAEGLLARLIILSLNHRRTTDRYVLTAFFLLIGLVIFGFVVRSFWTARRESVSKNLPVRQILNARDSARFEGINRELTKEGAWKQYKTRQRILTYVPIAMAAVLLLVLLMANSNGTILLISAMPLILTLLTAVKSMKYKRRSEAAGRAIQDLVYDDYLLTRKLSGAVSLSLRKRLRNSLFFALAGLTLFLVPVGVLPWALYRIVHPVSRWLLFLGVMGLYLNLKMSPAPIDKK